MAKRPLSPHLTDGFSLHWKWGPAMFVSILHRATGDGMAVVGLGVLVWWLAALAGGAESYASFVELMTSPIGLMVLIGLSWAFFTHMMSGLRHFVLDIGAGYELGANKLWSILSPLIAIVLTAGFWAIMLTKLGVL